MPLAAITAKQLTATMDAPALTIGPAGTPKAPSTVNRGRAAVRAFFAWAVTAGHLTENPALGIHLRRAPRTPPAFLTDAEVRRLLKTLATRLYSRTGDLLIVQRALGHRNIATTEIYTHLVDGALEEALERL